MSIIRKEHPFTVHALCLMTNHFHVSIETENTNISKIMQKLLHLYASEVNNKYDYTGHVFEGRYTSCLIEDERYFLEVSRYIHLNPVKAGMVTAPQDYRYSSCGLFMPDSCVCVEKAQKDTVFKRINELVNTERTLGYFADDRCSPGAASSREEYHKFVVGPVSHEEQELLIRKDMHDDQGT